MFKAIQHTASILGLVIQRGLSKEAHCNGHVENNEFARINMQCFVYENDKVHIDNPRLLLSAGPIARVDFTQCESDGLHVNLTFSTSLNISHASPDDVLHIYAVEYQIEVCYIVASVERQTGQASFDLPDLSEETDVAPTYYLYVFVESANTACISTLSPYEKKTAKTTATSTAACHRRYIY